MKKEKIKEIFQKRGIRISVAGCGCCGSPAMCVEVDGEIIFNNTKADLCMFTKEEKENHSIKTQNYII